MLRKISLTSLLFPFSSFFCKAHTGNSRLREFFRRLAGKLKQAGQCRVAAALAEFGVFGGAGVVVKKAESQVLQIFSSLADRPTRQASDTHTHTQTERAVLVVNKRNATRMLETCTDVLKHVLDK